jgi:hypothetical protein
VWIRLVHRNGEVKRVEAQLVEKPRDVGPNGRDLFIYWPIAGWYHVYSSGRIAGAKSWRVHPEDIQSFLPTRPKRTRKKRTLP